MRRKDREITDNNVILEILESCDCCRLVFFDGEEVYIVPLNFGYKSENEKLTLYFHSAKEGRKVVLINQVKTVGFEMDTNYKLHEAETACSHSARFDSITGNGKISIVEELTEKETALQLIMQKATHKADWNFTTNMLNLVCVVKVEVTKLSCKRHL